MRKALLSLAVALFFAVSGAVSAATVQITSVTSNLTASPKAGETIHLTVNAAGPEGTNLSHQFYYKGGYGTSAFNSNSWQVVQEWSPDNAVEYSFPSAGNNYLVGQVVPSGETWQFGDGQGGFNVLLYGDIHITAVTSDLDAVPEVDDTIRFTMSAVGPQGATLEYRFYYREGYGLDTETWGNTKWQLVQGWSTKNHFDYVFSDPGDYYLVGHVRIAGEEWKVGDPQGGFNVNVIDPDRPAGWTELTHGNDAEPHYDMVYAQDEVKRIDLVFDPVDWQAMVDDRLEAFGPFNSGLAAFLELLGEDAVDEWTLHLSDPIYRPCTVLFEGKTWSHVGVRFKGQSTLVFPWTMGIMKLPFRFDMDEFEDDYPEVRNQRFFGFKELGMTNNALDNSLLREKVATDIFREAGVPAPRTAFYRVFVDHGEGPTYFGLYTMVEVPRDPLLEREFGDSDGNLYKAILGEGATWSVYDQTSFEKKTNKKDDDWSDMEALFAALHAPRTFPVAWRAGLEIVLDVDGFLRWLAVNTVMQNGDTYGNMPQNYYMYSTPADGRLHWIPWDNNLALSEAGIQGIVFPLSLCLDPTEVGDEWPLIRYLIDDRVYHATYRSYVEETSNGVFSVARQQERLRNAYALIAPHVVGPEGEQEGYTFTTPTAFESEFQVLLGQVENRRDAALEYLTEGTCSELGTDDKVVVTVTVPPEFDCTPELISSVYFTSFPPELGMMPSGIGDAILDPEIGPETPFVLTTTQARLEGEYYLSIVVFCEGGGGGFIPVSGVDWVGGTMAPLTLGPGTGTIDAGTIELMLTPSFETDGTD